MIGLRFNHLRHDESGVAAIEFAMVAPVFFLLMMGIFNLGQMGYGISVLNGAVQQAARSSALETSDTEAADEMVANIAGPIFPGGVFTSQRTSYNDFDDIGRPESWNDGNNNGTCDNNESYVDENGSGEWEPDIGVEGNGGASDVVLYSVTVTYQPVFRIPFMPNQWDNTTLTSNAIKKNQPFADQEANGATAGVCS